ncbi:hypothetical protein PR202_ga28105 [Eleusine coracana subsp. coracana]|uniref:Uncharacterized protein n=1 Tax=Eleusine coracana subsp. coracana TaxID=191504 RepID=A0AAV5DIK5_ELECO|nr:hypothetical protein PR202_ga28105 [Eleusine coracana subsp. coracana]
MVVPDAWFGGLCTRWEATVASDGEAKRRQKWRALLGHEREEKAREREAQGRNETGGATSWFWTRVQTRWGYPGSATTTRHHAARGGQPAKKMMA